MPIEFVQPIVEYFLVCFRQVMERRQTNYDLQLSIRPIPTAKHRLMQSFVIKSEYPIKLNMQLSIFVEGKEEKKTKQI